MKPPKQRIPKIIKEVKLKGVMGKNHVTKEAIFNRFQETESLVLCELLTSLLRRESTLDDLDLIKLEEYTGKEKGNYVHYCGVKIGRLILGGPGNKIESLLKLENIFISFVPDEEYAE